MADTHLYLLGEAGLANGFRLAGFHVYPDATEEQLDDLLRSLQESRDTAFVILDRTLYDSDLDVLAELRGEGGRVLISQVPPLHDPDAMHSSVDNRIAQLLGQAEGAS